VNKEVVLSGGSQQSYFTTKVSRTFVLVHERIFAFLLAVSRHEFSYVEDDRSNKSMLNMCLRSKQDLSSL